MQKKDNIEDNFQWLEEENVQVLDWEKRQQLLTENFFSVSKKDVFKKDLEQYFDINFFHIPIVRGEFLFYTKKTKEKEFFSLYVSDKSFENEFCIFESTPEQKMLGFSSSPQGSFVALYIVENQSEMGYVCIFDMLDKVFLEDKILSCRHPNIIWSQNEKSLYYTGHPKKEQDFYNQKVFVHQLGQIDSLKDICIFGEGFSYKTIFSISLNIKNTSLFISSTENMDYYKVWCLSLENQSFYQVFFDEKIQNILFQNTEDGLYAHISTKNIQKIYYTSSIHNPEKKLSEWSLFFEVEEGERLASYTETRDYMLIHCKNYFGESRLLYKKKFSKDCFDDQIIEINILEKNSVVHGISTELSLSNNFFFDTMSWITSKNIYYYNEQEKNKKLTQSQEDFLDDVDLFVEKFFVNSPDGETIPLSVVSHKKNKEPKACIMHVYGGFGMSQNPHFKRKYIPWLKQGGVFAVAHVRGGGEKGSSWEMKGVRQNKKKSFEDLKICAEFLYNKKYTTPHRLGIVGGSNGGMTVLATAMLYPSSFAAVFAIAPLSDILKYNKGGIGERWVSQYGDAGNFEDREYIKSWSPLEVCRRDIQYPPVASVHGAEDTRVPVFHSRKIIAKLQSFNNEAYYILHKEFGHQTTKNKSLEREMQAEELAFFDFYLNKK